ncbi:MAG TPA: hypothetical protein VK982_10100, partial [Bacteroidales bacterium]|nr:hypothetical protein [Bacteroidales bacterium]
MNKEEKLDKVLEEIAKLNSQVEVTLTPEELEVITEKVSKEELQSKNEYLTNKYKNILVSFGCTNYEELYNIAQGNSYEVFAKNKDFPNLTREKREVTRNGKTYETTLYLDPKIGIDNKIKPKKNKPKTQNGEGESAKDLQPVIIQNNELEEAKKYVEDLTYIHGSYDEATLAKHLVDAYGTVQVSVGFKIT